MVKVQKPLPKTLSKVVGKSEVSIKKKSLKNTHGKDSQQVKQIKEATAVVLEKPLPKDKKDKKKASKNLVAEETVTLVAPALVKSKKNKNVNVVEKKVKNQQQPEPQQQQQQKKEKKAAKRPLILAAVPDSPIPKTTKAAKRPLILAAVPDSPIPTPTATKPQKNIKGTGEAKKLKKSKAINETNGTEKQQQQQETKKNKKKDKKKEQQQQQPQSAIQEKQSPKKKKNKKSKSKASSDGVTQKATPKKPTTATLTVTTPLTKLQKKKTVKRAYRKQQLKNKKDKKPTTNINKRRYEPQPYDEEKFDAIVNVENIKRIAKALKETVEKEVNEKKTSSIFSDYRYHLTVGAFKIANCPKRIVKLNLKHSLVGKDDDVVIIVPDLQRGSKVDYDPTIQHWEDIFREAGIEGIKIMPLNQLRKECNTYETVRKFAATYDYFLCDGRIVAQVAGFCGKIFQKPRTTFHAVRMENLKILKNTIEKSLRRTAFRQIQKGDLISIPVGNHTYTLRELAENVHHVVTQLKTLYPGGMANVRNMNLKIDLVGTTSLPIYMSMAQAPEEIPYVIGPREERIVKLKKVANDVLTKFSITKDAKIIKLTGEQMKNKSKLKETRAALAAVKVGEGADDADDDDDDDEDDEQPQDDDGEESPVPAKKARKEDKTDVDGDVKKRNVEKKSADKEAAANDDDDGGKEDDDDDDEDDDIDDEDDLDDDDDDDDEDGAKNDDDDDEDDDDDDGDDDDAEDDDDGKDDDDDDDDSN